MKTNNLFGKVTAFVAIAAMGLAVSCKNDESLSGTDATTAISESLTDGYFEDADDISVSQSDAQATARVATDDRICSSAIVTPSSGKINIDFGTTGCTDPRGNIRTGIIHITYTGTHGVAGFAVTETFENYSINGIKLEGTRTITLVSTTNTSRTHDITLSGGKATWPDATFATRETNPKFTRTVDTSAGTVTVTGNAKGTNRQGKNYTMDIQNALVYKADCAVTNKIFMAVQGKKLFANIDTGKTLTIDYGSGTCDRAVTITVGRISFNYTVNK